MLETSLPLRLEGAGKRFGGVRALDGLDLEVRSGEWLGLLGPNGAGKTTAMLAAAGLVRLDEGSVRVLDRKITSPFPEAVGLVPQEVALYPRLTARENLQAFGRLNGLPKTTVRHRIAWALDWTGLEGRADDPVAGFSGGMKRRLNIACGVLHGPRLVLLDEPTVGVDPHARQRIFRMLDELRSDGVALLHSTHELGDVEAMCDRLVVMDHGRAIAAGEPARLVRQTVGDRSTLTIELDAAPPPELASGFESARGRTLSCQLHEVASDLPRILDRVRRAGRRVVHLEVNRPSLADAFTALTGRELRE